MALRDGLVNLWKLDETSGTRADAMAQMDLSTLTGSPSFDTGVQGNALVLDGSSSVSRASVAHAFAGADIINLSLWVFPTSIGSAQQAALTIANAGSATSISCRFAITSGNFTASLVDTNGTTRSATAAAPSDNVWTNYFVRFVRNVNIFAYKNNGTPGTGAVGDFAYSTNVTSPTTVVGARASTDRFIGRLDQYAIWTRDLSADERAAVYNGGLGTNLLSLHRKAGGFPLASKVHGGLA